MEATMEAKYYIRLKDDFVECRLCPNNCIIEEGKSGACRIRKNIKGKLYTGNYGKISSYALDPIEKKPLYHFMPGKKIFSIGSIGCNFKCSFCQNYEIAHGNPKYLKSTPENIVTIASETEGNIGIAYTYNEPIVWYEYMLDVMKKSKERGLKNVVVTNGYINKGPLEELLKYTDAMNIDLKSFNEKFYRDICKGGLNEVMENIKIASQNCHVEISTLLIETLNTEEKEIFDLSSWLANIDKDIPLHLNRYRPAYKMDIPSTNVKLIEKLSEIAKENLNNVYIGNVQMQNKSVYCKKCGNIIVNRNTFNQIGKIDVDEECRCKKCGNKIKMVL